LDETTTLVWSAEQSGVLDDLTKDDDAMPQVKKEEYGSASSGRKRLR
jgi:hypothetical protein